jgi:predicted Rossmann fold nucleotide-binding protein DprA/Smf involved in DNA uptake
MLLVAPGRPLDPAVAGCLALLREAPAHPVVDLDELLLDLPLGRQDPRRGSPPVRLDASSALELLGPAERAVAQVLCRGPQSVDALVRACGEPPGVVAAALTILQLRGWASVMGAMQMPAGPLLDGHRADRHGGADRQVGGRRGGGRGAAAPTGRPPHR